MAIVGTLTKARKFRWIIYLVLSAAFSAYCYYDGWISTKYLEEPSDLWFNRIGAVVLAVVFVLLVIGFFKIQKTRVVVDDTGIDVNGKFAIAWSAITRLDDRNLEKGLLDLFYTSEGQEKKYTLDNYKVTCFDEMVDTLSRHRPDLMEVVEDASRPKEGTPGDKQV